MVDITNLSVKVSASAVWQSNESGDNVKNSWSMNPNPAQLMNPKNNGIASISSGGSSANPSTSAQQSLAPGMDQENLPVVPVERSHQDTLIYRNGWGQVRVSVLS